jgi:hypothetical protein
VHQLLQERVDVGPVLLHHEPLHDALCCQLPECPDLLELAQRRSLVGRWLLVALVEHGCQGYDRAAIRGWIRPASTTVSRRLVRGCAR